ncbi:hypothetical protein ACTHAM_001447 [Cellulomonas soli]|uniref:hypothetical protein n=1 Tax=Cellulomonas soli TaxID=931535 RepID=UPI003F85F581
MPNPALPAARAAARTVVPAPVLVLLALVLGLGLSVVSAAPVLAAAPAAATSTTPRTAAAGTATAAGDAGTTPVVLVGVTGVRWDDVTTLTTPALWSLSRSASIGLVAARSVSTRSCPADGWLGVSAGARAADALVADGTCRSLREPLAEAPGVVPGWADYTAAVDTQRYGARLGLLGEALADGGITATGIGAGAAIALADDEGLPVGTYVHRPTGTSGLTRAVRDALSTSQLVVVDAGSVRDAGQATHGRSTDASDAALSEEDQAEILADATDDPSSTEAFVEPTRAQQMQVVDARVGAAVAAAERAGATVLVVSLADSGRTALQLAAVDGPGAPGTDVEFGESLLTSGSTRQPGVIQSVDVTPTVLELLGLDGSVAALSGAAITPSAGPAAASARVEHLLDIALRAKQITRVSGAYSAQLVLVQAALFVAAAIILTRTGRSDRAPLRPALQVLRVASLALAAAPVASFLTGLVPWWRSATPTNAFWWTVGGWVVAITALALVGPWRRRPLGPAGVVAAVTVVVLVVDACTGSTLVIDSPMGAHRILAARFYGMSNQAFALLTAGGLLLAVVIADELLRRGRRTAATWSVALLGLLLVVVDGAPGLGSDFGGPPPLILAFSLLALQVSGRKIRWRTIAIISLAGAVAVGGAAGLDWLRPASERTHLGRFFATVLDGGLWDVVYRKLEVNLRVLTSWRYLVLAIGGVALTALVVTGPHPRRGDLLGKGSPMAGLRTAVPLLKPAVAAIGLALAVGFLINDSGIVVPATGIALAVPCLVAAAAQWRLGVPDGHVDVADEAVTEPPGAPMPATV